MRAIRNVHTVSMTATSGRWTPKLMIPRYAERVFEANDNWFFLGDNLLFPAARKVVGPPHKRRG
jgi:hypothetical protein